MKCWFPAVLTHQCVTQLQQMLEYMNMPWWDVDILQSHFSTRANEEQGAGTKVCLY